MKLSPAARRALVYVATGEHARERATSLVGFGELARHGLIEVNASVTRWRCSERGREVLATLPCARRSAERRELERDPDSLAKRVALTWAESKGDPEP